MFASVFMCVCLLSRYRLSNCISKMARVCFFWKSWVALKKPVLMQKMLIAQRGVPWPSNSLGIALATGQLRGR